MNNYRVTVGNIGLVHEGNNPVEARGVYGDYKRQSQSGYGRAAGEPVILWRNDEVSIEYGDES